MRSRFLSRAAATAEAAPRRGDAYGRDGAYGGIDAAAAPPPAAPSSRDPYAPRDAYAAPRDAYRPPLDAPYTHAPSAPPPVPPAWRDAAPLHPSRRSDPYETEIYSHQAPLASRGDPYGAVQQPPPALRADPYGAASAAALAPPVYDRRDAPGGYAPRGVPPAAVSYYDRPRDDSYPAYGAGAPAEYGRGAAAAAPPLAAAPAPAGGYYAQPRAPAPPASAPPLYARAAEPAPYGRAYADAYDAAPHSGGRAPPPGAWQR